MSSYITKILDYKELIIRCIASSNTPNQVQVCFDFIRLFEDRFKPLIPYHELHDHLDELLDHYIEKQISAS